MSRQNKLSPDQDPAFRDLKVTFRDVDALEPFERNARTHSRKQIRQIAESIRAFGFTNPILIDGGDRIIAGHGRVAAAKLLGITQVPTIRLEHLSERQLHAYVIADNKLAENAGWDTEILAVELQFLSELDLDFDLTVTGFEVAEIDLIIGGSAPDEEDTSADKLPDEPPNTPRVSRFGDLWTLGAHRLLCADARDPDSFVRLLADSRAQMVITDPPYNVPIEGHACGKGQIKHPDFIMAAGEMSEAEFMDFLRTVLGFLVSYSIDGSIHFVFMDWRHIHELLTAARSAYTEFKNLCVWNKNNGGLGSFYRSKHELVFVFKNGAAPHINNIELGRHGRNRTNVWDYAGVNTFRPDRLEDLKLHPTVKPVAMVADAILDCSRRGGIVLDCFCGSGTTLIAAEKTGRRAYAMELDPRYVDTAIRRWEAFTGEAAVHAETGLAFAEMAEGRGTANHEEMVDAK